MTVQGVDNSVCAPGLRPLFPGEALLLGTRSSSCQPEKAITSPRSSYCVLLSCSTTHPSLAKKLPAFPSNTMTSPFLKPNICALGCDSRGAGQITFQGWHFSIPKAVCSAVEEKEGTCEVEDIFLRSDRLRYLPISE